MLVVELGARKTYCLLIRGKESKQVIFLVIKDRRCGHIGIASCFAPVSVDPIGFRWRHTFISQFKWIKNCMLYFVKLVRYHFISFDIKNAIRFEFQLFQKQFTHNTNKCIFFSVRIILL